MFKRHLNLTVLVAVLFVQVIALAYQVKRPTERGPERLIRLWAINLVTPVENIVVHAQERVRYTWRNYFYLRDVRQENERLREENMKLRLEQVRTMQDASQAQRLQALLKFKEQFISQTVAAQVIGSSGSEQSRVIYIDKGSNDAIKTDMAVITPGGIVGKVIRVFPDTAQVLEINDQSSGVGAILEKSRLQGILKGTPAGETTVHYIMSDQGIERGELVLTSGGDRIFPKGLPIGQVTEVHPGSDSFLNIRVRPSARLDRLEEVLVITKVVDQERELIPELPMRASEILAQRLPTVPPRPPAPATGAAAPAAGTTPGAKPAANATGAAAKPGATTAAATTAKPAAGAAKPQPGTSTPAAGTAAANGAASTPTAPKKPAAGTATASGSTASAAAAAKPVAKPGNAQATKPASTKPDEKARKPVAQNQASPSEDNPQ